MLCAARLYTQGSVMMQIFIIHGLGGRARDACMFVLAQGECTRLPIQGWWTFFLRIGICSRITGAGGECLIIKDSAQGLYRFDGQHVYMCFIWKNDPMDPDEHRKDSSSEIGMVKSPVSAERVIRDLLKINDDNNEAYRDCRSERPYGEKNTKYDCRWGREGSTPCLPSSAGRSACIGQSCGERRRTANL